MLFILGARMGGRGSTSQGKRAKINMAVERLRPFKTPQAGIIGEMPQLGEIEKEYGKLARSDVVLTDERIEHIIENHGSDIEYLARYSDAIFTTPDEIIVDEKSEARGYYGTIFIIKNLPSIHLRATVRLQLSVDGDKTNSIISFQTMGIKSYERFKNKNYKVIYSREPE